MDYARSNSTGGGRPTEGVFSRRPGPLPQNANCHSNPASRLPKARERTIAIGPQEGAGRRALVRSSTACLMSALNELGRRGDMPACLERFSPGLPKTPPCQTNARKEKITNTSAYKPNPLTARLAQSHSTLSRRPATTGIAKSSRGSSSTQRQEATKAVHQKQPRARCLTTCTPAAAVSIVHVRTASLLLRERPPAVTAAAAGATTTILLFAGCTSL